jgi:tetratricopeptide (TPR) repeat protein
MSDLRNLVLLVSPAAGEAESYRVQLLGDNKPLAVASTRLERTRLLELEHNYDAPAYGRELAHALLTGNVYDEYQRQIGQVGGQGRLRIQLVIDEAAGELHALAWERLFHRFGDGEAPLAATAQTPFSRFLISGQGDQPATSARPFQLLLVLANPSPLPEALGALDVAGEVSALADLVAAQRGAVQGTLLPGCSGLPTELRQRLLNRGWRIHDGPSSWAAVQRHLHGQQVVHLLAHGRWMAHRQPPGQATAYLLLEDSGETGQPGGPVWVSDQQVVDGLRGVHPLPQLLFLAACESARRPEQAAQANPFVGLAPKLVQAGVPAVVAMQEPVEMGLAHRLMLDFYERLLAHGQVDLALNQARNRAFARNDFAWAIPVLFLRLADGQLLAKPDGPGPRQRLQAPAPPPTYAERREVEARLAGWLTSEQSGAADAAVTVAIQGIGGQGKSVLAAKLARACAPAFAGGVLWVEVGPGAPADNPGSADRESQQAIILSSVARELGLEMSAIPTLAARTALIQERLGEQGRLLAILDDLWAPDLGRWLLNELLPRNHAALITTRQLDLARALAGRQVERLGALADDEALTMLGNLLGALGRHRETARQVVHLLEGLPLALELAARRCDEGAPDLPWLLGQLQGKPTLGVLTLPGQPSRATSLEYSLSLSLQGLEEELATRFAALGLMAPTPFDRPALAALWALDDLDEVETQARRLVQAALLQRGEERLTAAAPPDGPVYVQHSLLHTYALALAQRSQQAGVYAQRQAAYYAALVRANWQQAELFWPQVEQAWRWNDGRSLDERMEFLYAVQQVARLRGRWELLLNHGQALLSALQADGQRTGEQAYVLTLLGSVYSALGEKRQALDYYELALPLQRQVGDKGGEATTLNNIGSVYDALGEKRQALDYYELALPLQRQVGDKGGEATTLNNIGSVYDALGEKRQALDYYELALPLQRQVGDKGGEATTLNNIGGIYADNNDLVRARQHFAQALSLQLAVGDRFGEVVTRGWMATIHQREGDLPQAVQAAEAALALAIRIQSPHASGLQRMLNQLRH